MGRPLNESLDRPKPKISWNLLRGKSSKGPQKLVRPLTELVEVLFAPNEFPDGVILATGTGIVPELDFALQAGDVVDISISEIGTLTNTVAVGKESFEYLAAETARPALEESR